MPRCPRRRRPQRQIAPCRRHSADAPVDQGWGIFVFFREIPDGPGGPIGALGVPLTAGRSVAVDPRTHRVVQVID